MNKIPTLWRKESTEQIADCRIFKILRTRFSHDGRNTQGDFYVMDTPSWVHVVPSTKDGDVILVRQFRFGNEKLSWEVPGGLMEEGESPEQAAARELSEETGYRGEKSILMAQIAPNPAIQNNICSLVYMPDVVPTGKLDWDEHEEIELGIFSLDDIETMISKGEIFHSLSITSIYFLKQHL